VGLVQTPELVDSANSFLLTPRPTSGEHLQHHAPERPNVHFGAVALAHRRPGGIEASAPARRGAPRRTHWLRLRADDLGRHPEDGALHAVRDVVVVRIGGALGDAEIGNLARAVEIEK